jgi:hypothetical protein
VPITTYVVSSNPALRGVLDTTLCDSFLSVTCDRSVVFSGSSGFLHDITEILWKVALNTSQIVFLLFWAILVSTFPLFCFNKRSWILDGYMIVNSNKRHSISIHFVILPIVNVISPTKCIVFSQDYNIVFIVH